MSTESEINRLKLHLENLEYRLDEYHRHFQETSEQRDLLNLDAAWGVANGLAGFGAFIGVFLVAKEWLGLDGWVLGLTAGVVGSAVQGWVMVRSDRGRFKDREKMHSFPEWDSQAQKLWD